jgi:RNA polymerase sigma factor for flagellar operon FliA
MGPIAKSSPKNGAPRHAPTRARKRAASARERAQARLWKAYRRRPDAELRNSLVESYQPFALEIVRRFAARLPRSVDPGDLETAGSVGLMNAIESFDPQRGVRFEAYCELRVKGALLDELRQLDWLPRPWRNRLERHKRALERLRSNKGSEPTDEELAEELEMSLDDYRRFFGSGLTAQPSGSLSIGDGEDVASLDVVADTASDAPGEKLSREELLRLVAQRLTEQEYRIVYLKYWEELSMREIGQLEGLSESRVCKIHARLLERLKDRFRVDED